MKKLIGKLLLFGLFTMSFYQANAKKAICDECDSCTGHYIVCQSNVEAFEEDYKSNCGPNSQVSTEVLEGC